MINPFSVPLLNTAVLLASGVTVTWAHHSLIEGIRERALQGLFVTVLLGTYFTFLQGGEYYEAPFRIADSVYGTTFFVATGFHGLHVLLLVNGTEMPMTRASKRRKMLVFMVFPPSSTMLRPITSC